MKTLLNFRRRFLPCIALIMLGLRAQGQPANITANFTMLALVNKPVTDLVFESGGKPVSFKAPSFARSAGYNYSGPTTMVFARMGVKDGKSEATKVGEAVLPAGGGQMLIVIAPSRDASSYTFGAVADAGGTPLGKIRIYNATPYKASVLCNQTQTVTLKPFEAQTIEPKEGGISIDVSYENNGKMQSVMNTAYLLNKDQKLSLFLVAGEIQSVFNHAVNVFPLFEGSTPAATPGRGTTTAPRRNGAAGG